LAVNAPATVTPAPAPVALPIVVTALPEVLILVAPVTFVAPSVD